MSEWADYIAKVKRESYNLGYAIGRLQIIENDLMQKMDLSKDETDSLLQEALDELKKEEQSEAEEAEKI